jgi:hypothetical protein
MLLLHSVSDIALVVFVFVWKNSGTAYDITVFGASTVLSESRCALRLRYVDLVQACIDAHGHHIQHLLQMHSDFPNADLQKVFANKIKRFQACIHAR